MNLRHYNYYLFNKKKQIKEHGYTTKYSTNGHAIQRKLPLTASSQSASYDEYAKYGKHGHENVAQYHYQFWNGPL
jgi:hypothetical protein